MRFVLNRIFFGLLYAAPVILLALTACGGGGGSTAGSTTLSHLLGGTTTGLTSAGLVLQNNGADDLIVAQNATQFSFGSAVDTGTTYDVTVKSNPTVPTHQLCSVPNGSATMPSHDIADIKVECVDLTFKLGGSTTGLTSDGLVLLNSANQEELPVVAAASGVSAFTFGTRINPGDNYAVAVKTDPSVPSPQTCSVDGAGTMPAHDVSTLQVTCIDAPVVAHTLGGSTRGLTSDGLVLLNSATSETLPVLGAVSGVVDFTFANSLNEGAIYTVTIQSPPHTPTAQTCTVDFPTGTMQTTDIHNLLVSCQDVTSGSVTVFVTVVGLTGSGLVLRNNGADNLALTPNNGSVVTLSFATLLAGGGTYDVSILSNPVGQTCRFLGVPSGMASGDVFITLQCTP